MMSASYGSLILSTDSCVSADRIGYGHSEGLFESWSNLYKNFGFAMKAADDGDWKAVEKLEFPGIEAGIDDVRFLENCVKLADNGAVLVDYK